jgi:Tol biopolymer transport system component
VYAYPSEIDAWRAGRKVVPEPAPARPLWKIPAFALTMLLCLVMVGNGIRPQVASAQDAGAVNRQLWTGEKVDPSGTVSSDGRLLSFTDWKTGDLSLHDLTTGQDRRLTNKGTWDDSQEFASRSAISRDGKRVAYGWGATVTGSSNKHPFFEVRLIDVAGGKPRVLTALPDVEFADVNDWSPDDRWLAVQLTMAGGTGQISLVSATDGSVRVLKSTDWRGPTRIAFSPDGKYLAYDLPVNGETDQRDVCVMAVDGSRDVPAVSHLSGNRLLGWYPDGKYLMFASDRSGLPGVWALPMANGKPQGAPELVKANINPESLGLTKSGGFYYSVMTSGRDIFVASMDLEAGKVLAPSTVIPQPYLGLNDSPQWSPDGKYLAYLAQKDSNWTTPRVVLAIRSMETGKVRELRTDLAYLIAGDYSRPRWSPDAGAFFVLGADKMSRRGIYRVDAQQGKSTPLVMEEPGQGYPRLLALTPDGKTLIVARYDAKSRTDALFTHDVQSARERELIRRSNLGDSPVSPNGRFLAVTDRDPKAASLLVIPLEGGEPRELLRVAEPETLGGFVAWSPDGKSLLFRKFVAGATRRDIWRISAEGGTPHEVGLNEGIGRSPSIHPDGHQVAYTTIGQPKHEIWALENFLPTSKEK